MHIHLTTRPAPRNPFPRMTQARLEIERGCIWEACASVAPPWAPDLRAEWTAKAQAHFDMAAALSNPEFA